MCVKKFIYLFLVFSILVSSVKAGVGCTLDGLTIYTNKNGGGKYFDAGGMMVKIVATPGCVFPAISPSTPCLFTSGTPGGYLASDVLECPVDESYFILGFGVLISIFSIRKIKALSLT
ncbi:hypothetical protein [Pedobacter frigiditerrae]|uniref:hypothetical protein n=1 Tax=Pedobacter frigiditerrae TaxID=2530452 RepID=UPI00292E03DA|nr:hypothetical protein [Pedobacter frigiditerrae]